MDSLLLILNQTIFFAIPLLITAIGAMFSEKSGVTNIALEGIMIIGAFFGCVFIKECSLPISPQLIYLAAIVVGAAAGGIVSLLHAWASVRLGADQTVSGTAINLFAPAFCIFMSKMLFGVRQVSFVDSFFIKELPIFSKIPVIGPVLFSNCYISTYIGIALFIILTVLIMKTRFGLRLSSCGENPEAAASAGIKVGQMRYLGVLISGMLAGMSGVILTVTTSTEFAGSVAGYGFLALAVLILGQWKPISILYATLFFSILKAISSAYSGIPALAAKNIPAEFFKLIPYVMTLIVLAVCSRHSRAPKAVGKPYDDGKGSFNLKSAKSKKTLAVVLGCLVLIAVVRIVSMSNTEQRRMVSNGYGAEIAQIMRSDGNVDDKSYMQCEWDAIVEYSEKSGRTRKYYNSKDDSANGFESIMELAANGNAKIIIISDNFAEVALGHVQNKYPNTNFIMVGGAPRQELDGPEDIAPNTAAVDFAEEESGFLAGYAAVMDGYRKLGFIGGVSVPSVVRYGYGFLCGAEYAAKELGLPEGSLDIKYNYSGTFNASPEVLSMATAWYRSGTEVIFACGGAIGNSIMKAAEMNGKNVIGVDVDQSAESPSIITSAMKDVSGALTTIFEMYENGEFPGGQNALFGAEKDGVKLPMETSRFRQFTQAQYDAIYKVLASDTIHVYRDTDAKRPDQLDFTYVKVNYVQ